METHETCRIGSGRPGPGRPKGATNKLTRDLKEMTLKALNEEGGVDYLRAQARDNPRAFLGLLARFIPRPTSAIAEGATTIRVITGVDRGRKLGRQPE